MKIEYVVLDEYVLSRTPHTHVDLGIERGS
jgi:hypothetical protein